MKLEGEDTIDLDQGHEREEEDTLRLPDPRPNPPLVLIGIDVLDQVEIDTEGEIIEADPTPEGIGKDLQADHPEEGLNQEGIYVIITKLVQVKQIIDEKINIELIIQ